MRTSKRRSPGSAIAYTDGSKSEGRGVGVSAITSKENTTDRIDDDDRVYVSELKGILLALSQINDDLVRGIAATSRAPGPHCCDVTLI